MIFWFSEPPVRKLDFDPDPFIGAGIEVINFNPFPDK